MQVEDFAPQFEVRKGAPTPAEEAALRQALGSLALKQMAARRAPEDLWGRTPEHRAHAFGPRAFATVLYR